MGEHSDDENGGRDDDTWALHLVVRVERQTPPSRADAYQAAAGAVLDLLHDDRATGAWAEPLRQWRHRRIRKLVRRARGAHWGALDGLDGVLHRCGRAEVRAFPPTTRAGMPALLDRLQVSGTNLPGPEPPASPDPDEPVALWVNPTVHATPGKLLAQVGHAAQLIDEHLHVTDPDGWVEWRRAGFPLAVCRPDPARWRELAAVAPVTVADAGFTEVVPGTVTAAATCGRANAELRQP